MSTKYYLPMAVMAMTALNQNYAVETTTSIKGSVSYIVASETFPGLDDGATSTDTTQDSQFRLVRATLTTTATADNGASFKITSKLSEKEDTFAADVLKTGKTGAEHTYGYADKRNAFDMLFFTPVFSSDTFSIAVAFGDQVSGYDLAHSSQTNAFGSSLEIKSSGFDDKDSEGFQYALRAFTTTAFGKVDSDSTDTSATAADNDASDDLAAADLNAIVSVAAKGFGYPATVAATYNSNGNLLAGSASLDGSTLGLAEGSDVTVWFVRNTDSAQTADQNAYGAQLNAAVDSSEMIPGVDQVVVQAHYELHEVNSGTLNPLNQNWTTLFATNMTPSQEMTIFGVSATAVVDLGDTSHNLTLAYNQVSNGDDEEGNNFSVTLGFGG